MTRAFVAAALIALAGCSGGGPSAPATFLRYELTWALAPTPPAPIAVGSSVTITIQERTCPEMARPNGPPVGSYCNPWYLPAQLAVAIAPMQASGQPCPMTIRQTGPGTLVATRTGPGDPKVSAGTGTLPGGCELTVRDPQTTVYSVIIDV